MAIKYTFVGHGTHILDIGDKKVVVDPFFTSNPATDISADSIQMYLREIGKISLQWPSGRGPRSSPILKLAVGS